ncbi:MAG: hypothetical protein JOZ02_22405 [Acidobacteria bacterium]|nr:hypothetical protein [Acidobacteriota bacterium]
MTSAAVQPEAPLGRRAAAASGALARLRERAEFGDALVFLYLLVFARQYLWPLDSNALAWALSVPLACVALYFYVVTKPEPSEPAGRAFWLVVLPPLLFFYLLRLPFPDLSWDVLNYHLLHAERSLRGTLFMPGDYFPTPAPYNPAPDTVTGLFRHALGYRLGTVVNLLALVWTARVVEKTLRPFVERAWPRAACVLLVVLSEHLLFQVNEYMVDLLSLPLLLEAVRLGLRGHGDERPHAPYVHAALLLGLAAALKLTNAAAILPIVLLCAYTALTCRKFINFRQLGVTAVLSFFAFLAPLVPFAVYLWRLTGNPFFPLANTFFKSAYWPTDGGWDARWGPRGIFEKIAWPVLVTFEPARHSELAVYSGRITLGVAAVFVGRWLLEDRERVWAMEYGWHFILACLVWSVGGMGYSRYGLYLEVFAGLTVVIIAAAIVKRRMSDLEVTPALGVKWRAPAAWRRRARALFILALCAQATLACVYALKYEWSMRPTLLSDWRSYRHEARYLFRDRRLKDFMNAETRAPFEGLRGWVESGPKSNGVEALIDPDLPIVTASHPEYFATRDARQQFVRTVESGPPRMLSLCMPEDLAQAREYVKSRGLTFVGARPVQVPFFSQRRPLGMMLVEAALPEGEEGRATLERFWRAAAFRDQDYRASIEAPGAPTHMRPGERAVLNLRVRNLGPVAWPALGERGMYQVNAGDRWLDREGKRVVNDLDGRTALAADVPPGGEVSLQLPVTAPREPGDYVLEIDMIHEGVTFFFEKGSKTLRLNVKVEP